MLFEMNYFLGVGLICFMAHSVYTMVPSNPKYMPLYNWLYYQVIFLYVALGACLILLISFAVL